MVVFSINQFEITAEDKRRYQEFLVTDDRGKQRNIIFKAREELPVFSTDPPIQSRHLGVRPRLIESAEENYRQWTIGLSSTPEATRLFVDATPLGAILLSLEFSDNPRLRKISDEMQQGIYSDEALAIVDSFTAIMNVDVELYDEFVQARDRWFIKNNELEENYFRLCESLITGVDHASFNEDTRARIQTIRNLYLYGHDPGHDAHTQERLKILYELHEQGRIDEFLRTAAQATDPEGKPLFSYQFSSTVGQFAQELREGQDELRHEVSMKTVFRKPHDPQSVLTLARALAGDQQAGEQVARAVQIMLESDSLAKKIHEQRVRRKLHSNKGSDELSVDDLVLVHATAYEPKILEDGTAHIHPRIDTQGFPRSSLHFTLNHRVVGHLYGDWDQTQITIIAPLGPAIKANGIPDNLRGIDTWWHSNPGIGIDLPDAVIVKDAPDLDVHHKRESNMIYVKSEGFTRDDVNALFQQCVDAADLSAFRNCFDRYGASEEHQEFAQLIDTAGVQDRYSRSLDTSVVEQIREELKTIDISPDYVQKGLADIIRGSVVDDTIRSFGAQVHTGGMWESSHDSAGIEDLAASLGTRSSPHSHTVDAMAEESSTGWFRGEASSGYIPDMQDAPIEARRAVAISGVATMSKEPVIDRGLTNRLMG